MTNEVKMNLITPPDVLKNENVSVLLINLSEFDKSNFNDAAKELKQSVNLYLYDEDEQNDIGWLITVADSVDYIFLNIDNSKKIEWLIGWILNYSNTFYLTSAEHIPYNKINVNKVYDITQAIEGVNYFERS